MERGRLFLAVMCILQTSLVLAQTGELDEDATTVQALVETEESVDRLRLAPLDLRRAKLSDLLEIPGISRREALLILEAVRSGRVDHLDQLKLIPGISSRTFEMILPYVDLTSLVRSTVVAGTIRYSGGGSSEEGIWRWERSRYHVLVTSSVPRASAPSGFLNARWTGDRHDPPRVHASTTLMEDRLQIHVGHLSVEPGTPFIDQGRRPGLFRPSDWRRMNSSISRVRLGTDDATARKGATFSWHADERRWLVGLLVDQNGMRDGLFSWSEAIRSDLRLNVSWQSGVHGVSWGVSHEGQRSGGRVEIVQSPHEPYSGFAFGRWSLEEDCDIMIYFRHLRTVSVRGLPRQGGDEEDEDGGTLSLASRPSRRWKWQLTADVGRLRSMIDVHTGTWSRAGGASVMSELYLTDRDLVSAEVGRGHRRSDLMQRISVRWTQTVSRSLEWSMSYSSRREGLSGETIRYSQLVRYDVHWRSEVASLAVRWLRVHGAPGIEFWNVGPGPSALGSIRPVSGRTSLVQAFAQRTISGQLLAAFIVTHASTSGHAPGGRDLTSSILLDFRL